MNPDKHIVALLKRSKTVIKPFQNISRQAAVAWIFVLIVSCLLFSNDAQGDEDVRVVIFPFEIYSAQNLAYLQTELPKVLGSHLRQEGALVVDQDWKEGSTWKNLAENAEGLKKIGIQNGADYIIWGSVSWIGKKFSIDARMAGSFSRAKPELFFVEGDGIENLSLTVKKLAQNFGMKLFKRDMITRIRIEGNSRIEADAIKKRIKTKPGDMYVAGNLSKDLKSVYAMGYFEDIRIEAEDEPGGKAVVFIVKEKPTVRYLRIKGNSHLDEEEIRETLNIKIGSIMNIYALQNNVKRIESLYKEKNYHNVKVTYQVEPLKNNQADVLFIVDEGEKQRIKEIRFEGNRAYTDKELKKIMKTSEKGFFSFLTMSGELNRENLNNDVAILTAFYHNNGYIRAKVGEPQIEFKDDWIYVTLKIQEGARYRVGKVQISGDDGVIDKNELRKHIAIDKEEFFNREVVRNDTLVLTDMYSDEGYAYADIEPKITTTPEMNEDGTGNVNVTYLISVGKKVRFEKIIITGNTKTRDKVIRRELQVYEKERYNGRQLKKGIRNLHRLDYFEDIKVNTTEGTTDDQMILKIDVTEKATGTFSFGGGYSSVEDFFIMGSVSQRNLFGRGQTLQLKAEIGGSTNRYTLSFTEPWLFNIPLSAGFDLYNWERDYDTYDKDSKGGGIRFGYPVFENTRVYLSYAYDIADIRNVSESASLTVKDLEGTNVTSAVAVSLRYDTRDRIINTSDGSEHSATIEYAGLGGDIAFTKYLLELGRYFPIYKGLVGFLHAKTGYVRENSGGKLPDYERFYLGGINTMRGFDWRAISSFDDQGIEIGGNKFVQFNAELLVPLVKKAGVMGVLFLDTGNVYNNSEDMDLGNLRESIGFGFRWYSPMGPIRLEYGHILDPGPQDERRGRWEFALGTAF